MRHGVTRHGFALNIDTDPEYWQAIIPCGLQDAGVANLSDMLDPLPSKESVEEAILQAFGDEFGCQMVEEIPAAGLSIENPGVQA